MQPTNHKMTYGEVLSALGENFNNLMSPEGEYSIVFIDPVSLLQANRLDLIPKIIFADHYIQGIKCDWSVELYTASIGAINGFVENDQRRKIGANEFIDDFRRLIDNIRDIGFDPKRPIPVVGNEILDGAHRTAVAIALGIAVPTIELDCKPHLINYEMFASRGLQSGYLDEILLQYVKYKKRTRFAIVWPAAVGKTEIVHDILSRYARVVARFDRALTERGQVNLVRLAYKNEPWLGSYRDGYVGAKNKADWCFATNGPVRVFLLDEALDLPKAKDEIRAQYGIEKNSIHITDSHDEALDIAQTLLNKNSLEVLNSKVSVEFPWFNRLFGDYASYIRTNGFNPEEFCIDGSATLAVIGVREARDLDFLAHGNHDFDTGYKEIDCHNNEIKRAGIEPDEIIFHPGNYFFYCGFKFVSCSRLREKKMRRAEQKDLLDVRNLDAVLAGGAIHLPLNRRVARLLAPRFLIGRAKFLALKARYLVKRWIASR